MSANFDTRRFIAALPPELFVAGAPLYLTRAPGRLDLMGGVSDYSGGLCLEWPLQCATHCAVQRTDDGQVIVHSANAAARGWHPRVSRTVAELLAFRTAWSAAPAEKWARYALGAIPVLAAEYSAFVPSGARIFITSEVPPGAGLASSAALEVAVLQALIAAFELPPADARGAGEGAPRRRPASGRQIARLAQRLENEVAGAPCGPMDQLTCALGLENHLLRLRCQPDLAEGYLSLPQDVVLFGIDSGEQRTTSDGAYARARCATFMGRRLLKELLPRAMRGANGQLYLANISTDEWRAVRESVPAKMTGRQFLETYGEHEDDATRIEPGREYSLRLATEHPIYEADRVARFAELLRAAQSNAGARAALLRAAGDLMIQSHFSYDHRCHLGSDATDALVRLAREAGPQRGVLGAKITGGGKGGTVAFLMDKRCGDSTATAEEIAAAYETETGVTPRIFRGSSPGAEYSGVTTMTL